MFRATAGTWLNYAATYAFYLLFARRFGSGTEATAFVLVYGIAVAVSGILVSTIQSVIVPRMLSSQGELLRRALWLLILFGLVGATVSLVLFAAASPIATLLAGRTALPAGRLRALLRIAAAFLGLRIVAGELNAVGLARGRRLLPTLSPAVPSTCAVLLLLLRPALDVRFSIGALTLGSLLETLMLLGTLGWPLAVVPGPAAQTGFPIPATLAVLVLLGLIAPLERIVVAAHSVADAARYDYAIRSLAAVGQLLIGGLHLSALGGWSNLAASGQRERLGHALVAGVVLAGVVLLLAASAALVSGHQIVALAYERGQFLRGDTNAVTRIMLLGLPGFCADGVGRILVSALQATRENHWLNFIGVFAFVLRVTLVLGLAARWGAGGVAVAYSCAQLIILAVLTLAVVRRRLWPRDGLLALGSGGAVTAGTVGTALLLAAFADAWPAVLKVALVMGVFVLSFWRLRPVPLSIFRVDPT